MGESEGDMVGDSCLARPRRCSEPGDSVRGLMGAGRRRGELLMPAGGGLGSEDSRSDEWMEGLLRDICIWEVLRDAWIEGLLRDEERPAWGGAAQERRWRGKSEPACCAGNVGTRCQKPGQTKSHWAWKI